MPMENTINSIMANELGAKGRGFVHCKVKGIPSWLKKGWSVNGKKGGGGGG